MFHHISHPHPHKPQADLSKFFVVTVISNPVMYKKRYELYWRFKEMCDSTGVTLITVEESFGLRDFMVTETGNPLHVQVTTVDELWHKENHIDLGIDRAVQLGANFVAWVDADCRPACPPREWFEATWHALQHYRFVQMWEQCVDLDLNCNAPTSFYNPQNVVYRSFIADYIAHGAPSPVEVVAIKSRGMLMSLDKEISKDNNCEYPYHHHQRVFGSPGLAWAADVDAISAVGGMIDFCIVGAGDWYMAHALIGAINSVGFESRAPSYERKILEWQNRAEEWIKRDVGFVRGLVLHDFHGPKNKRGYGQRHKILGENHFDPDIDIKYDSQGCLILETRSPRQIKLRDQLRAYFRSRNEDSTESGE